MRSSLEDILEVINFEFIEKEYSQYVHISEAFRDYVCTNFASWENCDFFFPHFCIVFVLFFSAVFSYFAVDIFRHSRRGNASYHFYLHGALFLAMKCCSNLFFTRYAELNFITDPIILAFFYFATSISINDCIAVMKRFKMKIWVFCYVTKYLTWISYISSSIYSINRITTGVFYTDYYMTISNILSYITTFGFAINISISITAAILFNSSVLHNLEKFYYWAFAGSAFILWIITFFTLLNTVWRISTFDEVFSNVIMAKDESVFFALQYYQSAINSYLEPFELVIVAFCVLLTEKINSIYEAEESTTIHQSLTGFD